MCSQFPPQDSVALAEAISKLNNRLVRAGGLGAVRRLSRVFGNVPLDFRPVVRGPGVDVCLAETCQVAALVVFRLHDSGDFANFDFLAYVVAAVPERTQTYTYASQYLQLFTEPIPRKLWPGKPAGAPVAFFSLNNYGDFIGRTVTLVGDGWMSGGWAGVLLTMAVAGGLLGLAHRWFWQHSANNMIAIVYLVGLAMLPQWFRDGGISIAKFFFWNLSPLVLWLSLTWVLKGMVVPGCSVCVPGAARLRLVRPGANIRSDLRVEEVS